MSTPIQDTTIKILVLVQALLIGCSNLPSEGPASSLRGAPQRIVSLAPAYTETLIELGLADRIMGVTPYSDYLAETKNIQKVGGYDQPSLEKIVSLKPDLVLAAGYVGQRSIGEALERLGIGVATFDLRARGIDGIFEMVQGLGELCEREEQAREILAQMQRTIDEVKAWTKGLARPRVYVEVGYNPLFTCAKGSFIHELIAMSGGQNIASDINKPYPRISPEFVIESDPQVIILPCMGRRYGKQSLLDRSGWQNISAVKAGRVYDDLDPQIITIPSPNLILKGLPELARRIHGTGL